MSKLKRQNWQYKKKEESGKRTVDPGIMAAVKLANYEWNARLEARKVMAVDKEVMAARVQESKEITDQFTDWDFGCAALALYRLYGYDAEECARFLHKMQEISIDFQESGMVHTDIWNVVRDEIGLDISVE